MNLPIRKWLSILFICFIFLSSFSLYEKEHYCTGESCLACATLKKREEYKKQLQQSAGLFLNASMIAMISILLPLKRISTPPPASLVLAKVRLDL